MKRLSLWFAAIVLSPIGSVAIAQESWPARPVTIVVPYAPGGVTDSIGRLISPYLKEALGQPILVENKAGGGGIVGTEIVANAKPDGYTLLMMIEAGTIAPALYPSLSYDPLKSFAPITLMAKAPQVIVAHPSFPPNTLAETISLAKSSAQPIFYASSGNGTSHHLAMEQIKHLTNIKLEHVPYKGGGQAITDLVAGQVRFGIIGVAPALQHIKAGKLKALAVTSLSRLPLLPDVPTVIESGIAGFETFNWFGILAPAGTPKPIIDRLHSAVVKAMHEPALASKFSGMSLEITTSDTPAHFAQFLAEDMRKWPPLVKAGNIKAN